MASRPAGVIVPGGGLLLLSLGVGLACDPGGNGAGTAHESGADSGGACAGVPVLDWDNFGHAFMLDNCSGCHAAGVAERHGAPEWVVLDSAAQVWALADLVLAVAAVDEPTMPPRELVPADERTRLGWWLRCGTPGT